MKKVTIFLTLSLAIAVVMLFTTGCTNPWQHAVQEEAAEKATERALERAAGGNVDVDIEGDGGTTTITSEEGETTWGSTEIPENFPGNVPVYPNATVTFSHVGAGADGESASASLETTDDVDTVSSWYKTEIDNNGWSIEGTDSWGTGSEKYISYMGEQGEKKLSVGISASEGVTMITLSVFQDNAPL